MQAVVLILLPVLAASVLAAEANKDKLTQLGLSKDDKPDCALTTNKLNCACPVCQNVIRFARALILDHVPSEEEALDKICARILSEQESRMCEELIKKELPVLIKYVRARMIPKQICAKFC